MADAQASGACSRKAVWVQVPSPALNSSRYAEEFFYVRTGIAFQIYIVFAGVAEWQTRRLQVPVVARLCGFKSHLLHKKEAVKTASFF